MPEPQVVSSLSGNEAPIPPLTSEAKGNSDKRMGKLFQHAARRAGAVVPTSKEKEEPKISKPAGEVGKIVQLTETPASAEKKESPDKIPDKGKGSETPAAAAPPAKKEEEKPDSVEKLRRVASDYQSRADIAEKKVKDHEDKLKDHDIVPRSEYEELKKAKKYVDDFVSDPVTFVTRFAPDLANQLANAGDPIRLIESEVGKFQVELDRAFRKEIGPDWKFNEVDALRPGTPSFRYKLALDERMDEIRRSRREYAENRKRSIQEAEAQIIKDKDKLKEEFGFTEADIKEAEQMMEEKKISYYNMVKAFLVDKIVQRRLDAIINPPPPPPEIADKGGHEPEQRRQKVELSDGGKKMISTLGVRGLKR